MTKSLPSRQSEPAIEIQCSPVELAILRTKAAAAGLPLAAYLRKAGTSARPCEFLSTAQTQRIASASADLNRLADQFETLLNGSAVIEPGQAMALLQEISRAQGVMHRALEETLEEIESSNIP